MHYHIPSIYNIYRYHKRAAKDKIAVATRKGQEAILVLRAQKRVLIRRGGSRAVQQVTHYSSMSQGRAQREDNLLLLLLLLLTSLLQMDKDRLFSSVSDFSRSSRTFAGVSPRQDRGDKARAARQTSHNTRDKERVMALYRPR